MTGPIQLRPPSSVDVFVLSSEPGEGDGLGVADVETSVEPTSPAPSAGAVPTGAARQTARANAARVRRTPCVQPLVNGPSPRVAGTAARAAR
jgi:hypothetical protein